MKFNMSNIHTIFESSNKSPSCKNDCKEDKAITKMDNTFDTSDMMSIFDNICPITGTVYAAMKNAAADPKNLKITVSKDGNGDNSKMFVEAVEFMTFCEASGMNIGEAAEEIIDTYKEEVPGLENSDIHVVFPSDSLNKNILGVDKDGRAVSDSWPMQLMRGCRRYGLKIASNVDNSISESADINDEIDALQKRIDKNEKLQSEWEASHGSSNDSLLDQHDKLLDKMEELTKKRRNMK